MIDIVNHSVICSDLGLLQFFYPNYKIVTGPILFSESPIIYTGDTKYINQIKSLGIDFIIVTSLGEFNLDKRETLLDLVFSKYKRKIPKYLLEFYQDLDNEIFIDLCKQFWITGKWNLKEFNNSGVFIEFLKSFKTDTYTITKTYLQLLNKVGAEYIEMSILTFLNKVVNSTGKISNWYKKIIEDYRKSKYMLIKPAITNYCESPIYRTDLRIFNLILDLNRKNYRR